MSDCERLKKNKCSTLMSYSFLKCPTVTNSCRTIVLSILKIVRLLKAGTGQMSDHESLLGKTLTYARSYQCCCSDRTWIRHKRKNCGTAVPIRAVTLEVLQARHKLLLSRDRFWQQDISGFFRNLGLNVTILESHSIRPQSRSDSLSTGICMIPIQVI